MKIIRVCTLLNFGGLEQRLINISNIQDENEWIFCAIGTGGIAEVQIQSNGKQVIILESKYRIPSIEAIRRLVQLFKRERPDVVHTSGAEANFHGIIAAKLCGVKKLISEEIGVPKQNLIHKISFSFLYQFSSFMIANSLPVWKYLKDSNSVKTSKLRLIPNPILSVSKSIIPVSNYGQFRIITVSRLKSIKNIEGILKALSQLKNEGFTFLFSIYGDGDYLFELQSWVERLGLHSEVEFKGFVPNPFHQIIHSDLFVLNSYSEGFSNALVEAMSFGVPCLATSVGAAPDIIKEDQTGWLVEIGDPLVLYSKLKVILTLEKEKLQEIGLAGKASIGENFSLEKHHELLMEIYKL